MRKYVYSFVFVAMIVMSACGSNESTTETGKTDSTSVSIDTTVTPSMGSTEVSIDSVK
jgi:ABC-type enterochelin transport system substrate-binding protein